MIVQAKFFFVWIIVHLERGSKFPKSVHMVYGWPSENCRQKRVGNQNNFTEILIKFTVSKNAKIYKFLGFLFFSIAYKICLMFFISL